jgi:hypothetical protein
MANTITAGNATNGGTAISSDTSGTLELKTGSTPTTALTLDTSGNLQMNSGYGSVATAYGCRAWVNFNGTGTVAIRASGNVTSLTDNGVGSYTVTMTTAMPDTNFVGASSATLLSNNYSYVTGTTPNSTTTFSLNVVDINGTQTDPTAVQAVIFR